jgi:ornithine cyclodeaminase/alanine dehydrogenase-like protein (mu-crystallin family)
MAAIEIRYISGHDVERLAIDPDMILAAVDDALLAQGRGEVVLEPREHLVPNPAFDGHFNVLRAYVAPLRARWRAPMAVTAPVRHSVIAVASTIARGTPVRGS